VIHRAIAQGQQKAEVTRMCRVLGVSRSGFYAARRRQREPAPVCATSVPLKSAFAASGGYGSRRLRAALNAQGLAVGRHRVRTLMRRHGLRARWRRKFVHTTDSRHPLPVAENVLQRHFTPTGPDRAWVCDITYIHTHSGWLWLIVHSDRGSQYASQEHRTLLARHGLVASMSRKGNCWDTQSRMILNVGLI